MKPILIMLAVVAAPIAIPVLADVPPKIAASSSAPSTSTVSNAAELYRQGFALLAGLSDADSRQLGRRADGYSVATMPLDLATANLVARQKLAINLARTAASMPEARWEFGGDAKKVIELGNAASRLSALLVLQARHELLDGKVQQALDDLMAALALSRYAAADPTLMSKLVEISAQRPVVEVLAQQLPALPKEILATLSARLDRLPNSPTMSQVILGEHEFAKKSAARQGIAAAAMVAGLRDFYSTLADGGSLSPSQFAALVDDQVAKFSANPWAKILGPSLKRAREPIAVAEAQQAMLKAAINIVLQGEAAAKASKDPFGNGPFGYQKLPEGFELSSELKFRDQPVKLRVGQATETTR